MGSKIVTGSHSRLSPLLRGVHFRVFVFLDLHLQLLDEIEEFLDTQVILVEHDKRLVVVLFLIWLRRGQSIRDQFFPSNEREKYLIDRQAFIFRQLRQPPHFDNGTSFDVQTSGCHQTVDESVFIACIEQQREVRAQSMLDVILNRSKRVVSFVPG